MEKSNNTYDSRNNLLGVTNPDGKTVSYSYDSLGLRRTMTEPDGGLFTYSYDQAGWQRSVMTPQVRLSGTSRAVHTG